MRSSKFTKPKKKGSQLLSKEQNVLYKLPTQIKLKIKHQCFQVLT